jgi:hypothetical protein
MVDPLEKPLTPHSPSPQLQTATSRADLDETLIADARRNLTAAQMVERKLTTVLGNLGSLVSQSSCDVSADLRKHAHNSVQPSS